MRLTDREYWERHYAAGAAEDGPPSAASEPSPRGSVLRRWLGQRAWAWTLPYDDYLLWNAILPRHLGAARGWKAIEIGSAPGRFMVKLAQTFGVVPFGVEYTASGARANR